MTKQLYEEALADVKRLTAVAEDNAKRAVLEAVMPRIKQLIEHQLLGSDGENEILFDDEQTGATSTTVPDSPVPIAPRADSTAGSADAITVPDEEGKVTLDLDALACEPDASGVAVADPVADPLPDDAEVTAVAAPPEQEYVLGVETLQRLESAINSHKKFNLAFSNLSETVTNLKAVSKKLRESAGYGKQIARTISRVENMYDYVQERVTNPAKKKVLEQKLETFFQELTKLQELKMSKKLKDLIKEDDTQLDLGGDEADAGDAGAVEAPGELTLKLTGLPDDVDLDSVGVDLVAGADDAGDEGGDELDLGGDEGGDDAGGDDLGDLDLGGDESGDQMESLQLSDDTVVEIDENMLYREIARMKKLREQSDDAVPSNAGNGVDAAAMDDFGGGADDGEPFLDGEVTTESDYNEADEVVEEMDEAMPVAETQNRRKADDNGASPNESLQSVAMESRRLAFEKRIQERAKARAAQIVKESRTASGAKKAQLKKEYAHVAQRHNASVARVNKINESRSNSGSKQPAESKAAVLGLRKQLAETNLYNVKLVYANKVLQNETLTKRQKAQVIGRLDEAKTVREAKLVYNSIIKTLAQPNRTLKEGRDAKVIGSSSRVARTGSAPSLNEGFETDRWAQLAGITKK